MFFPNSLPCPVQDVLTALFLTPSPSPLAAKSVLVAVPRMFTLRHLKTTCLPDFDASLACQRSLPLRQSRRMAIRPTDEPPHSYAAPGDPGTGSEGQSVGQTSRAPEGPFVCFLRPYVEPPRLRNQSAGPHVRPGPRLSNLDKMAGR